MIMTTNRLGCHYILICSLFSIILLIIIVAWATASIKNETITDTAGFVSNESLELLAIKDLHSRLDDNNDGQVDLQESDEFVREELHQSRSQSTDRSHSFHSDDDRITLDELWKKWIGSQVYNWSYSDVTDWLVDVVELPELVPQFQKLKINGKLLPLIATNTDQFLQKLDIKGHQRRKLQLRATDVVLFGPLPYSHSYWKDIVMSLSVIVCCIGLSYGWRQHRLANKKIDKFLEEIRIYETELKNVKEKLRETADSTDGNVLTETTTNSFPDSIQLSEKTREEDSLSSVVDKSPPLELCRPRAFSCIEEELCPETENLRMRVWTLENQLESLTSSKSALKELLQESCHQEWYHLDKNKKIAEEEVIKAQKMCDKIKRKRSSVIGAFRLANSSTLEDAGLLITRAVNKMQKITESFDHYHKRWRAVEQLCGFTLSITTSSTHHPSHSSQTSSTTNSPRGFRSGSIHRRYSQTSSEDQDLSSLLSYGSSTMGTHSGSTFPDESIIRRGYGSTESNLPGKTEGTSLLNELPTWNSAPSSLYRRSSLESGNGLSSTEEFIDGRGLTKSELEETQKWSIDSLDVIEEEKVEDSNLRPVQNGSEFNEDSQSEGSSSGSEKQRKSRLSLKGFRKKSIKQHK